MYEYYVLESWNGRFYVGKRDKRFHIESLYMAQSMPKEECERWVEILNAHEQRMVEAMKKEAAQN